MVDASEFSRLVAQRIAHSRPVLTLFQHGNAALHEAAWNGYSRTLELLCKAKANVHLVNKVSVKSGPPTGLCVLCFDSKIALSCCIGSKKGCRFTKLLSCAGWIFGATPGGAKRTQPERADPSVRRRQPRSQEQCESSYVSPECRFYL